MPLGSVRSCLEEEPLERLNCIVRRRESGSEFQIVGTAAQKVKLKTESEISARNL